MSLAPIIMLVLVTAYVQRKCELFSHLTAVFVVEVSGAAARAPSRPRALASREVRTFASATWAFASEQASRRMVTPNVLLRNAPGFVLWLA